MATNFNYFTQATSSIPAIEGVAGAFITWLDWVLDVSNTNGRKVADQVYTGANKAVYRYTTGQRFYLRVDDAAAQDTLVRMYESMSDVDTGVDPCPFTTTYASAVWRKSFEANGNNRDFRCLVWGRGLVLYVKGALAASTGHEIYGFFEPVREDGYSDAWNTTLVFRNATGSTASSGLLVNSANKISLPISTGPNGYAAVCVRNPAGTIKAPKTALCLPSQSTWTGQNYPNTPYLYRSHGVLASYQTQVTGTGSNGVGEYRGHIPYLWGVASELSDAALDIDDTWTDTPLSASFTVIKATNTTVVSGDCLIMETTDSDPLVP